MFGTIVLPSLAVSVNYREATPEHTFICCLDKRAFSYELEMFSVTNPPPSPTAGPAPADRPANEVLLRWAAH